jgi:hypothetical protein
MAKNTRETSTAANKRRIARAAKLESEVAAAAAAEPTSMTAVRSWIVRIEIDFSAGGSVQ